MAGPFEWSVRITVALMCLLRCLSELHFYVSQKSIDIVGLLPALVARRDHVELVRARPELREAKETVAIGDRAAQ